MLQLHDQEERMYATLQPPQVRFVPFGTASVSLVIVFPNSGAEENEEDGEVDGETVTVIDGTTARTQIISVP